MPDTDALDAVADHLYVLRPDEFVPARDDAVAQARERGDRDLAKAIARLRRPTRAAWLANLLARRRGEQLDGLLALAGDLAEAQRHLDGGSLRALSSQRNRLVAAMAREAGRLAHEAGDSATEPVLRELQGILEAALADGTVADEVRSGRLTRTISYSGFGPAAEPGAVPTTAPARREQAAPAAAPADDHDEDAERKRAQRQREREERQRALAEAERDEDVARDRLQADEAARDDAESAHAQARERVTELAAELEDARREERSAAAAARTAASAAKESARAAGTAATRTARARARLEDEDL